MKLQFDKESGLYKVKRLQDGGSVRNLVGWEGGNNRSLRKSARTGTDQGVSYYFVGDNKNYSPEISKLIDKNGLIQASSLKGLNRGQIRELFNVAESKQLAAYGDSSNVGRVIKNYNQNAGKLVPVSELNLNANSTNQESQTSNKSTQESPEINSTASTDPGTTIRTETFSQKPTFTRNDDGTYRVQLYLNRAAPYNSSQEGNNVYYGAETTGNNISVYKNENGDYYTNRDKQDQNGGYQFTNSVGKLYEGAAGDLSNIKNFRTAFNTARQKGLMQFKWNNKDYNTVSAQDIEDYKSKYGDDKPAEDFIEYWRGNLGKEVPTENTQNAPKLARRVNKNNRQPTKNTQNAPLAQKGVNGKQPTEIKKSNAPLAQKKKVVNNNKISYMTKVYDHANTGVDGTIIPAYTPFTERRVNGKSVSGRFSRGEYYAVAKDGTVVSYPVRGYTNSSDYASRIVSSGWYDKILKPKEIEMAKKYEKQRMQSFNEILEQHGGFSHWR